MPAVGGTVYATVAQLQSLALPSVAWTTDIIADAPTALQSASDQISGLLGSRWKLPLLQWGYDFVQNTCWIAADILLVGDRGISPNDDSWKMIHENAIKSMAWAVNVSNGRINPANVVDSGSPPNTPPAPRISSQVPLGWEINPAFPVIVGGGGRWRY